MPAQGFTDSPARRAYDVVIVGGAMMGSAIAFYLTRDPAWQGRVLVIERDPSYADSSTAHTNSCIRQQFTHPLNIRLSRYTAEILRDFPGLIGDARAPRLAIRNFGYLYLADSAEAEARLRAAQAVQAAEGAGTQVLTRDEIAARYPFYDLDGVRMGTLNTRDEGYWEGGTVFDWFRRTARARGAEYLAGDVAGIETAAGRVTGVRLADGTRIGAGIVVNAAGTRAAAVAAMAGLPLPVEPRKRVTWVVQAAVPLVPDLPLTVDPSGIHMRQDGAGTYMVGAAGPRDPAVAPDDFHVPAALWETHVWPRLAARIPAFAQLRVLREWAGHYAYNVIDQNAVAGPHPALAGLLFCNGFSGHGLQHAPGMGRALAEWILHGRYLSLDLGPFGVARLRDGSGPREAAVI